MKTIAIMALSCAGAIFAQPSPSSIPRINFTDTTLDNGLRVIISEDHYAPIYALAISYKVGSRDERKGRTGFAHLFEHMMFKGSENVGVGELDYLIYTNGGAMNGTTNNDRTLYYEVLPKNQLDLGIYLEADRMRGLVLNQENLENQRQAVKEERRLRVDNVPYGEANEKIGELVYDNFAYHHSVIGSMEDLDAAGVDDVKQFFKTYYAPNNAVVAIAGDVNTKEVLEKMKKYFATIPRQEAPKAVDLTETPRKEERRITLDDKLARLPRIDLAWMIPDGDSTDARALAVAGSILGGGVTSRLYQLLVKDKELVSSVFAGEARRAGPSMFRISATVRPGKDPHEVESLITEEISKFYSSPVTEKELGRVRIALKRSALSRITVLGKASALADDAALYNDPNRINTEIPKELEITPEQIQSAAKKLLVAANRVVVETRPAAGSTRPAAKKPAAQPTPQAPPEK